RNVTGVQTCALPIYQVGGAEDRGQKVVEVMRDAGREATHRLHLLRLAELLLEPLALRHVIDHDLLGPPAGERDSMTAGLHLDERDRKSTRLNSSHVS